MRIAQRIALVPPDIVQLNKRTVHRAMEIMGLRAAIRSGTEICALGIEQASFKEFIDEELPEGPDPGPAGARRARSATTEPRGEQQEQMGDRTRCPGEAEPG